MTYLRTIILMLAMALLATPAMADRKDELQEKFKARYPELRKLLNAGTLGETYLGYVDAVKDQKLDSAAQKLMTEENADRKELYTIIAGEVKTLPENVAAQNGKRRLERLPNGHWYKFQDRGWAQKK